MPNPVQTQATTTRGHSMSGNIDGISADTFVRPGPDRYINEPGIALSVRSFASHYRNPVALTGVNSRAAFERYTGEPIDCPTLAYDGSVTMRNIAELSEQARRLDADAIIAIGGGRLADTAKYVAEQLGVDLVIVPTIAATCAAYTPLTVVYDELHRFASMDLHRRNSTLLAVDPALILKAPKSFLVGGIGDTLAKWYEARPVFKLHQPHTPLDRMGLQAAELARDTLLEHGAEALAQFDSLDESSPDSAAQAAKGIADVLDAIIALGGEVGGLAKAKGRASGAHAIHDALTIIPQSTHTLHGLKVAYGILVQLTVEGDEDSIDRLLPFYRSIGLPTSLAQMDIPLTAIDPVAQRAAQQDLSFVSGFPNITPERIARSMRSLETRE